MSRKKRAPRPKPESIRHSERQSSHRRVYYDDDSDDGKFCAILYTIL